MSDKSAAGLRCIEAVRIQNSHIGIDSICIFRLKIMDRLGLARRLIYLLTFMDGEEKGVVNKRVI